MAAHSPEVSKVRLTVLIALLFSALCAGAFRTPPIMFMAALLTSAPLMGVLIGRWSSRQLKLTRSLPETGMAGSTLTGEITLSNKRRWPIFLIHTDCGQAPSPHAVGRNSSSAIAPLGPPEHVVPLLRGHSSFTWQQQWTLRQRGHFVLEPARSGALDPLRLGNVMPSASSPHEIVVFPRVVPLEQLGFLSGGSREQSQPRHSTSVADAMDFHGVRPWLPGEAVRRAHWKTTARTGQLHVIEWEESPASDLMILLDVGTHSIGGNQEHNTLELAIMAAASIALHLLEHGCRLQLGFFETAAKSNTLHLRMLNEHSIGKSDTVLRALAEITPIAHPEATATRLFSQAMTLGTPDSGILLLASSRSDATHIQAPRQIPLHTLLVDADSFEAIEAPEMPFSTQLPYDTRRHRAVLRHGEPISAVLEAHW